MARTYAVKPLDPHLDWERPVGSTTLLDENPLMGRNRDTETVLLVGGQEIQIGRALLVRAQRPLRSHLVSDSLVVAVIRMMSEPRVCLLCAPSQCFVVFTHLP
eukprot:scaffold11442_cov177-Amphora_coffeaeformis.AAC.7